MNVRCSGCNKAYRVDDARLRGKSRVRLRCVACKTAFEILVPRVHAVEGNVGTAPSRQASAPGVAAGVAPLQQASARPKASPHETQNVTEQDQLTDSGKLRAGAPMLPEGKRVSLAVLSGPDQGKMIPVEHPRMVIGRSDAEVVLSDPEISRRHAVLEIYGDRFVVRDLNSTNGTFVADRKITAEELENHEEFRVGTSRMMFIITTPEL